MRVAWSLPLSVAGSGLSAARETGEALVRDEAHSLHRIDRLGRPRKSHRLGPSLTAAVVSDDGRYLAAGSKRDGVWLLSPAFEVYWRAPLSARVTALALDHLGHRLAVADETGGVRVYDGRGVEQWRTSVVRPLVHLAFVPEAPVLAGSAEFGFVCAFSGEGKVLWRDGPLSHVGSLATTGIDDRVFLACYTEGVVAYAARTGTPSRVADTAGARLAGVTYVGDMLVTVGAGGELVRRDAVGNVKAELRLDSVPQALVVDPPGDGIVVLTAAGVVRVAID